VEHGDSSLFKRLIHLYGNTFAWHKEQVYPRRFSNDILLQIQALATDSGTCYRFRHLLQVQALATDSGTCYRFRQTTTESCNLLRVTQSATESSNLLQSHAICYRVTQSATESCNLHLGGPSGCGTWVGQVETIWLWRQWVGQIEIIWLWHLGGPGGD
jgi:hypothetical protein